MVLVISLAIIIFVTGCSVDSLYIIILALLNDVSMIPVGMIFSFMIRLFSVLLLTSDFRLISSLLLTHISI